MLPGPTSSRSYADHGSKIFLAPSALDKLTRLHITYPMLFSLINGAVVDETTALPKTTNAGVLEFTAEEGKVYLPYWMMQTLLLQPGDILQVRSTDLPPGTFIRLQPQSPSFIEISDPKAVLENVMRNFACLTTGDIFTFEYNDQTFEMAVLETKPAGAISVLETDLEVDFATPVGYVEPERVPTGMQNNRRGLALGEMGTMARSIGYEALKPGTEAGESGNGSKNFIGGGVRLKSGKPKAGGSKSSTPRSGGTPVPGAKEASEADGKVIPKRKTGNGPQPLRLLEGQLFFGYELKPVREKKKTAADGEDVKADDEQGEAGLKTRFEGQGNTLRGGPAVTSLNKKRDPPTPAGKDTPDDEKSSTDGRKLGGRTLRDNK